MANGLRTDGRNTDPAVPEQRERGVSSIDVVIPCYRYGRYLRECVESVLAQDVAALRVLVIDDASPDDTPAVGQALCRQDARVSYRRHDANQGHIRTYNEGIEWTRADYMLLLSADDYLLPGALPRAMALLDCHPEVGLCCGRAVALLDGGVLQRLDLGVDTGRGPSLVLSGSDFVRRCARAGAENIVPTPTAVVRTVLLKQHGGYRADLPHSGDFELWLRLAAHSSIGFLRDDQAVYRRHAENMSLGYFRDGHLTDLQQRKAAFDAFGQAASDVMTDARLLHAGLIQALARRAIGHASGAFNARCMDLSRRLGDFALDIDPAARGSWRWRALALKRFVGPNICAALLPLVHGIRAALRRVRQGLRRRSLAEVRGTPAPSPGPAASSPAAGARADPGDAPAGAGSPDGGGRMILVLNCDDAYAMPLATTLRSAVEAMRSEWPLDVRVLTNRFSQEHRRRVLASLPEGSVHLQWVAVDAGRFSWAELNPHISPITCARLLIPEAFDASVSRVLYIDADILVLRNLRALWNTDLQGALVGAVIDDVDAHLKVDSDQVKDVPRVASYFNAGVLLVDVDRWRRERVTEKAMRYLHAHPASPFTDQDALNVACDGRWTPLDARWNFQYHRKVAWEFMPLADRPFVIHFVTRWKPWKADSLSAYSALYDAVRARTRYSRSPVEKLGDGLVAMRSQLKRHLKTYRVVRSVMARSTGL